MLAPKSSPEEQKHDIISTPLGFNEDFQKTFQAADPQTALATIVASIR